MAANLKNIFHTSLITFLTNIIAYGMDTIAANCRKFILSLRFLREIITVILNAVIRDKERNEREIKYTQ